MKQIFIAQIMLVTIALTACDQKHDNNRAESLKAHKLSALEGNWVLVSREVNGKIIIPARSPQQFKMFNDGYFSLIMYDTAGNFVLACAGPYETNDNMYKETFAFHSNNNYINAKDWEKWEMKGDTLIFYGFEKAEVADGKDVTEQWNSSIGKFTEKRVRVK